MDGRASESNIWKLYLISVLNGFALFVPIMVLFYKENGMSMSQVFLLQSIFSASAILTEIPTGCFSDLFGRKKSIVIGGILSAIGFAAYSLSDGFWGFLVSEIVLGIGMSFVSGSDSGMLYEALLERGRLFDYRKIEGRAKGMRTASEGISSICGGLLAMSSLRLPLYCDAIVAFLIVPVALTLAETGGAKSGKVSHASWKLMKDAVIFALLRNCRIRWLIVYSASVNASTLVMYWMIQPYLVSVEAPIGAFGIIMAFLLAVSTVCSLRVNELCMALGRKSCLMLSVVLPFMAYLALGSVQSFWMIPFFSLSYAVRGINDPIILDCINGSIPSEMRVLILSIKGMVSRFAFMIAGPLVGFMSDRYSLGAALAASGVAFFVTGTLSLVFLRKHKAW